MASFPSTYVPSGGTAATRAADVLPLPFPARPQAMTIYLRFVELGSIKIASTRIVQISNAAATGASLFIRESGGNYQLLYQNTAGANVTSTQAAAPSIGQRVELVGQQASDGSVKLIQSIDGAAATEASQSSALALESAWGGPFLWINSKGNLGTFVGFIAFRNIFFHRGVQTLVTMRRGAGVL